MNLFLFAHYSLCTPLTCEIFETYVCVHWSRSGGVRGMVVVVYIVVVVSYTSWWWWRNHKRTSQMARMRLAVTTLFSCYSALLTCEILENSVI